jgi:hypothetical protein
MQPERRLEACKRQVGLGRPSPWSLDILDDQTWVEGLWFYQAAAAPTRVW